MHLPDKPLISTIIPTYNTSLEFLKEAIKSLLSQSYFNWEAIIVNDGSNLKYKKLLEEYVGNLKDKRFSITHLDKNYGLSTARNEGAKLSRGEIITFLDADDLYLPWHFEHIINKFKEENSSLILHTHNIVYISIWNVIKVCIYTSNFIPLLQKTISNELESAVKALEPICPRLAIKHEVFEKISYDPTLRCGESRDLSLQIMNNKELFDKCSYLPTGGYLYRIHPSKHRLSNKLRCVFNCRELLVKKYKDNETEAGKVIKQWQIAYDHFKYNKLLLDYFNNCSIKRYMTQVFRLQVPLKEKIKSIKVLIAAIINNFIIPLIGFDLNNLVTPFRFLIKGNRFKEIKTFFKLYTEKMDKEASSHTYAICIFNKFFN